MLFFKTQAPNSSFNKMLILAPGETVKQFGRLPTESELFSTIEKLLKMNNQKLGPEQTSLLKMCAFAFSNMEWPQELIPAYRKFFKEFPAEMTAYDHIKATLGSHGLQAFDPEAMVAGLSPDMAVLLKKSMRDVGMR